MNEGTSNKLGLINPIIINKSVYIMVTAKQVVTFVA